MLPLAYRAELVSIVAHTCHSDLSVPHRQILYPANADTRAKLEVDKGRKIVGKLALSGHVRGKPKHLYVLQNFFKESSLSSNFVQLTFSLLTQT